jgi:hypothetical protein
LGSCQKLVDWSRYSDLWRSRTLGINAVHVRPALATEAAADLSSGDSSTTKMTYSVFANTFASLCEPQDRLHFMFLVVI